jgi:DNA repair exonuclease SbcCD ATPase subunit
LQADLKINLEGHSIGSLKNSLSRLENELARLQVLPTDQEAVAGQVLGSVSSIEKRIAGKQVEVENAKQKLREFELEQPSEAEINQLASDLVDAKSELTVAQQPFLASGCKKEIDLSELNFLESTIATQAEVVESGTRGIGEANISLAKIEKDLEHSGGVRRVTEIEAEMADVTTTLEKEGHRQSARLLLMERIKTKMNLLAEQIPAQLAEQVAMHLSQLTLGLFSSVEINDDLSIHTIFDSSGHGVNWTSAELSTGERTLVALAIRVAIALSVADIEGTAFLMLDDAFTSLDPCYLTETEGLIEKVAEDGRIQVVLFTCHENWAVNWESRAPREFSFVRLEDRCSYFMDRHAQITA